MKVASTRGRPPDNEASMSRGVRCGPRMGKIWVAFRVPVLLAADELAPEYQWRLVKSLFAQRRSLIEGSLATGFVEVVCLLRTFWPGFVLLLAGTVFVLWRRMEIERSFARAMAQGGAARLTPDAWARRFTVGAGAFAVIWGLTALCGFVLFTDPVLQMFVVMVEATWLTGAMVRNAASPAACAAQSWVSMVPTALGALLTHPGFVQVGLPLFFAQISATQTISSYVRTQMTLVMMSEQRLEAANARLTELSATDGLTGIGNRRAFDATLQTEWARAMRDAADLGLLVIDADHFKSFNDRYGHPAGDECLRLIAEVTQQTLRRPPDFAARFGGEEFVAVLPGTDEAGARDVAERVRLAVLSASMAHEGNPVGYVTVSIGAASMAPRPGDEAQKLTDLADRALYGAKQGGRNQVRTASDGMTLGPWAAVPAGAKVAEGRG